jgi:hypothetical protein
MPVVLGAGLVAMLVSVPAVEAEHVYADNPLNTPQFSVDNSTPLGFAVGAGSILEGGTAGTSTPDVIFTAVDLGLPQNDDINGMSYNRYNVAASYQTFLLMFGVGPGTVGATMPDAALEGENKIFNVQDQAERNQDVGDLYISLDGFNRFGTLPKRGGRPFGGNNTLSINQGDTGGVDQDLSPEITPYQNNSSRAPADNADGAAYPTMLPRGSRGGVFFYFSVSHDSPPMGRGATIFVQDVAGLWLTPAVYAAPADLGLVAGDDIDALIVLDSGNDPVFDNVDDQVIFSLAPGSPSLSLYGYSPADVLTASFGLGSAELFAEGADIGLDATDDDVDCLELVPVTEQTPFEQARLHAIYVVWPDDCDGADVWPPVGCECTVFADCFNVDPVLEPCDLYDLTFDGVVDCADWHEYNAVYAQNAAGDTCVALTVEEFVAALLGFPMREAHPCMADMNFDGRTDGLDIRPYIDALLAP